MSEQIPDLWPTIDAAPAAALSSPAEILREQGERLRSKTEGAIWGEVVTSTDGGNFVLTFYFRVMGLGNYRYQVLTVQHPPTIYPLKIRGLSPLSETANNENEFLDQLRAIFAHEKTQKAIHGLLITARA